MKKIIKKISGFCLCKNVQFKAFLPVQWCSNCHCTRCQKGHGSGFVTWVGFKKDNFSVIKGKEFLHWYPTSKKSEFGFCSKCGSSILYQSIKCPDEIHITLVNIIDDLNITPQYDSYFDTHVSWLKFDESIPKKTNSSLK
jgi:hypothetical protein